MKGTSISRPRSASITGGKTACEVASSTSPPISMCPSPLARVAVTVCSRPSRRTSSDTVRPAGVSRTIRESAEALSTGCPW